MNFRVYGNILIMLLIVFLAACSSKKEMSVNFDVQLDGKPVASAKILKDGKEIGTTNTDGHYSGKFEIAAGKIKLKVTMDRPGVFIDTWEEEVDVAKDAKTEELKFNYSPRLISNKYVKLTVLESKTPVAGAEVRVGRKKYGATDANGEFIIKLGSKPRKKLNISVKKKGYIGWRKRIRKFKSGAEVSAYLKRAFILQVSAFSEVNGRRKRVRGMEVKLDGRLIGKTNKYGNFRHISNAKRNKKATLTIEHKGYVPKVVQKISLDDELSISRYFYSTKVGRIRLGIFPIGTNTSGKNLGAAPIKTSEALNKHLSKNSAFKVIGSKKFDKMVAEAKLTPAKITKKGWYRTKLRNQLDLVVLGSITKNDRDRYVIQVSFFDKWGKKIFSQIEEARRDRHIDRAGKKIAIKVMDLYPFSGYVVQQENKTFVTNLGENPLNIERGNEFTVLKPMFDEKGRARKYQRVGKVKISKTSKNKSWAEVLELKEGEKIQSGYKIVRISSEDKRNNHSFKIRAVSEVGGKKVALPGVNVYFKKIWKGATDQNGELELSVRSGKSYKVTLYRHGFSQLQDKIRIRPNVTTKSYTLDSYSTLFRVESDPAGARVIIDEEKVGVTPLKKAKHVPIGFHRVRLELGGQYRPWDEIVEFNQKEKNFTGSNSVLIYKDYLRLGEGAEKKNDINTALKYYSKTTVDHPDYADARSRLAQLYLDEKNNYDYAIREYENTFKIPEVKHLVYKQYAVNYTNLGHAYYQKASSLVRKNKKEAAKNYGKAIQSLRKARENTRFFPNEQYEEALHDTFYYLALSYQKLHFITKKKSMLREAELAWKDYFDFFPSKLNSVDSYKQKKESAERYLSQIKSQS